MVSKLNCECTERYPTDINSWKLFEEMKIFFEEQAKTGIFDDIPVEEPFYTWHSEEREVKWFAAKWYKCNACGCLWEFRYPEFPAVGKVRKFQDGIYHEG